MLLAVRSVTIFVALAVLFALNLPASARTIHIVAFGDSAIAPGTDIAIVEFGTNDLRSGASMQTVRTRMTELIRSRRARKIEVLVVGLGSLDLASVAKENNVLYAQWKLPPGKYRARDGAHYNAQGYAIVVARMLPLLETLIARAAQR